jgi:hypothetical protein
MKSHDLIDQRSLAFGRAIAARLVDDPSLIEHARANIRRWLETCSPGVRPAFLEWLAALDAGTESVLALLTGPDERATRLRQSNPFAGVLPQKERNEILLRFEALDKASP